MRFQTASLLLALGCLALQAQQYTPVALTGFNADGIYQKGETRSAHTPLDNANWIFYGSDVKESGGLKQTLASALYGVPYQLADFGANNMLHLTTGSDALKSGTLSFGTPVGAELLFVLGASANGQKDVKVTVCYSDGSKESVQAISFHDWYGGEEASAVSGLGRMDKNSGSFDSRLGFGLFDAILPVSAAKEVASLMCEASEGNEAHTSILAVTAASGHVFGDACQLMLVNNSHLDTQWNWDVKTTIEQYVAATLNDNMARLKAYPHFRFNFEGAVKYQWMKEYYPALYERLKQLVAEERWCPAGGSWDANETMVSSAESLLRNLLYGQTFYKREFGRKGGTDIMVPDCFGFSAALPSIAAHCGFTGFHTQKLSWGSAYDYGSLPTMGKWRGVDGSEIYCVLKMGAYDRTWNENLAFSSDMLATARENRKQYGVAAAFRYTGKSGDRGGAMSDENAQWLEKSITADGPVKVRLVTPTEMFAYMAENDHGQYPVVDHELPMRTHGVGCYTSQTMMKYWNRRNEQAGDAAERSAVTAQWLGGYDYPRRTLTEAWQRVIWHQFHDDLPGTCIPRAYGYSQNDEVLSLLDFTRTTSLAASAVASQLNTETEHTPLVVYNPLAIDREDVVEAEVEADRAWTGIRVTDASGQEMPAQLTRFAEGRQHFIFLARVPSTGFAVFDLQPDAPCTLNPEGFSVTSSGLENDKYRVSIDTQTGDIKSIYDKRLGQELLSANLRLALMACKSTAWPAWEIPYSATRATSNYVNNADGTLRIEVAEDGPLRKALRIERTRLGSTFVQYVRLCSAGANERVDVWNEVDWQSRGYLLKLEANLRATNQKATFDNSLGFISRGLSTENFYEYPAHQWADQTNTAGTYGVSILNDCKYGWDKPSTGRLRMSLIYSPEVADAYSYQAQQDLGLNRFQFSIYSHSGKVGADTQWQSDRLNQPLRAFLSTPHEGTLGASFSFIQNSTPAVAVRALKLAEDDDRIIVRLHELTGQQQEGVTLSFPTEILWAEETNGLEERIGDATFSGRSLTFSIGAFAPKTFAIRLKTFDAAANSQQPTANSQQPLELEYNSDVMSLDANRSDGNTGTLGMLFPGELLPDTLWHDGIPFVIGPRAAMKKNALTCREQTIQLPDGAHGRLHIAAFSITPSGETLTLLADGQPLTTRVPSAIGNVADRGTYFSAPVFRNENVAFTATHSHEKTSKRDIPYQYLHLFHQTLTLPPGTQSITLPENTKIYLVAATVEMGNCDQRLVALSSADELFPTAQEVPAEAAPCGQWLVPGSISASGYTSAAEAPKMAADGCSYTKWCDASSSTKYLQYTFSSEVDVCQWQVLCAGIESTSYVAAALRLQRLNAETSKWEDVDAVTQNTENHIIRGLAPVRAKRFRLLVDSPVQGGAGTARIYQFNLYGHTPSEPTALQTVRPDLRDGRYPVYTLQGVRVATAHAANGTLRLPQLPSGIYVVAGRKLRVR